MGQLDLDCAEYWIDERGETKGESKARRTQKPYKQIALSSCQGPRDEVAWVNRKCFGWVIDADMSVFEKSPIARMMHGSLKQIWSRPWTTTDLFGPCSQMRNTLATMCTTADSFKLKKQHVDNPPEMWIRKEGAFDSIVAVDLFMTVQEIVTARSAKLSDEELLEHSQTFACRAGAN